MATRILRRQKKFCGRIFRKLETSYSSVKECNLAANSASQCASCGYRNEEGAVFCGECGKKLG